MRQSILWNFSLILGELQAASFRVPRYYIYIHLSLLICSLLGFFVVAMWGVFLSIEHAIQTKTWPMWQMLYITVYPLLSPSSFQKTWSLLAWGTKNCSNILNRVDESILNWWYYSFQELSAFPGKEKCKLKNVHPSTAKWGPPLGKLIFCLSTGVTCWHKHTHSRVAWWECSFQRC